MVDREEYKRKLLVEINRLRDDLKLVQQEEPIGTQPIRLAEVESRLRNLIRKLEGMK